MLGRDYSRALRGVEHGERQRIPNARLRVYIGAVSGSEGREPPSRIVEKPPAVPRAADGAADASDSAPSPFRALLAAALTHSDAALGLACAYAELAPAHRGELLDAVIADARA